MSLSADLEALSAALSSSIDARGFSRERLHKWAATIGVDRDARNRLTGSVEPPRDVDVTSAPVVASEDHAKYSAMGWDALKRGEVALCVLAGGMATRMGGVVKALVEALPGKTFLDLRLAEQAALRARGARVPLWLMTSEATRAPIEAALAAKSLPSSDDLAVFEQCVSLRLTPEGRVFHESDGPSVYATGHGDLPDALRTSGLLGRFIAGGGKYVWIANLDNLGATIDPAILGFHLAHGGALTVEVVDKVAGDRGGGPVIWNGRRIIAEEFRLPKDFDPSKVPVFNTNTFIVDARALDALDFEFTFVEVEKTVDEKKAIQFERLLGEITVPLEPRFVRVPREGVGSRFLPVKDHDELRKRRPEIELIATSRGILATP